MPFLKLVTAVSTLHLSPCQDALTRVVAPKINLQAPISNVAIPETISEAFGGYADPKLSKDSALVWRKLRGDQQATVFADQIADGIVSDIHRWTETHPMPEEAKAYLKDYADGEGIERESGEGHAVYARVTKMFDLSGTKNQIANQETLMALRLFVFSRIQKRKPEIETLTKLLQSQLVSEQGSNNQKRTGQMNYFRLLFQSLN